MPSDSLQFERRGKFLLCLEIFFARCIVTQTKYFTLRGMTWDPKTIVAPRKDVPFPQLPRLTSLTLSGNDPFPFLLHLSGGNVLPNLEDLHIEITRSTSVLGQRPNNYHGLLLFLQEQHDHYDSNHAAGMPVRPLTTLIVRDYDMGDQEAIMCLTHPAMRRIPNVALYFRSVPVRIGRLLTCNPSAYGELGGKASGWTGMMVWRKLNLQDGQTGTETVAEVIAALEAKAPEDLEYDEDFCVGWRGTPSVNFVLDVILHYTPATGVVKWCNKERKWFAKNIAVGAGLSPVMSISTK